ncbi:MAG: hypothetical protein E7277_05785 [Lachnospiraceae bacterium]|nr:hypothetical protein [Lachnospiraceae bacterium]
MKLDCDVIQDLLPLYVDKVSSESSNELIENHLQNCEKCKMIYEQMKNPPVSSPTVEHLQEKETLKAAASHWKEHSRKLKRQVSLITAACIFLLLGLTVLPRLYNNYFYESYDVYFQREDIKDVKIRKIDDTSFYIDVYFETDIPEGNISVDTTLTPDMHRNMVQPDIVYVSFRHTRKYDRQSSKKLVRKTVVCNYDSIDNYAYYSFAPSDIYAGPPYSSHCLTENCKLIFYDDSGSHHLTPLVDDGKLAFQK